VVELAEEFVEQVTGRWTVAVTDLSPVAVQVSIPYSASYLFYTAG
jgi:hypothetical protein